MTENHFWKTIKNIFANRASSDGSVRSLSPESASVYVEELTFGDGTKLALKRNSIVVVTGPNNSGKSSVLRAVERDLLRGEGGNPVVKEIKFRADGAASQFRDIIKARSLRSKREGKVMVDQYEQYDLSHVETDQTSAFVGKAVSRLFFSRLNAAARLNLVKPAEREDWRVRPPAEPLQWLDFELEAENEISAAFRDTFGLSLIVNRFAGRYIVLHICEGDLPVFDNFNDYLDWISSLPALDEQGDGMKSFAAALLGLKIHPKGLILLDEPEAFLHYPQARRLAEIVSEDTAPETQIWLATHSDEIVRGLLDKSNDRIVVVRLDRVNNATSARILNAEDVKVFWTDPLLRTSDVLSALFHEVAVICEGESDVRFFRALVDANKSAERLPDFRFYHVGGKDKIASIVLALRALNLPVCVAGDLDMLSDPEKFLALFSALGGNQNTVKADLEQICRHVNQRSTLMTGDEASRRLKKLAESAQSSPKLSSAQRQELGAIQRETSAWGRLKSDGYRGFENATIIQAFERVYEHSKNLGLLINREGELEGLCRDATQSPKSKWVEEVLTRDLAKDASLEDARRMLGELFSCVRNARFRGKVQQTD